jgi:excisionase family DNA binding protein
VNDQANSVSTLSERLDVSQRTARRLIQEGQLKAHRIGRQWRVFEPDFQDYLKTHSNRGSESQEVRVA